MIRSTFNLFGGVLALVRLAMLGALSKRNRYWQWRQSTAFGRFTVSAKDRRRAVLDYGRWVHSMRRFR